MMFDNQEMVSVSPLIPVDLISTTVNGLNIVSEDFDRDDASLKIDRNKCVLVNLQIEVKI